MKKTNLKLLHLKSPLQYSIALIFCISVIIAGCKKDDPEEVNTQYLPEIETVGTPIVSSSTADCYGMVKSDKGFTVTERGFCYGTVISPTLADEHIVCGAGSGNFEGKLINLLGSTRYYVRAYATNEKGTSYGSAVSFETGPPSAPVMQLYDAADITASSATVRMVVTDRSGSIITEYGICYGTEENPDITGLHIGKGDNLYDAVFTLTGLTDGTRYYVRGYTKTNAGVQYYSQQATFQSDLFSAYVKDIDGNKYLAKKINGKMWMFEDLRVITLNNGTPIFKPDPFEWPSAGLAYREWTDQPDKGLLYNFNVVESEKVCPQGWHVATMDEWEALAESVDYKTEALKSIGFATDRNAFVGGLELEIPEGFVNYYWSGDDRVVVVMDFDQEFFDVFYDAENKLGVSVRCVEN